MKRRGLKKQRNKKKGLSPIIATVLLIFLVLILATIVFLWARGFFTEQLEKNGVAVETQCREVSFLANKGSVIQGRLLEIELKNTGEVPLFGVSIKEIKGGDEEAYLSIVNLSPGESKRIEFNLESFSSEKVIVYPVLLGKVVNGNENKEYTCLENPTTINLL